MYKITDANSACAEMSYNFIEEAFVYPITPSSPMASKIDSLISENKTNIFDNNVHLCEMQSEAGVAGALHGALISGSLASTYTSSQGLLLMIPNMYKIAGEMLPAVIHVSSRSLATHALSIEGDHQDIYAARTTGFCMLASSNLEDAYYMALISHLAAIESSLPFLHFFDGFRTSHEINKLNTLEKDQIKNLINYNSLKKFKEKSIINNHVSRGLAETSDIYFQVTESRNLDYDKVPEIVNNLMQKINKIVNKNYKPFEYYGNKDAEHLIIAMGSVTDTIKKVIDNSQNKIGLISVHLYRPFNTEYLIKEIPKTIKNIAVLDKTKEFGSTGEPLFLDVLSALKNTDIKIYGGRYGLSGKDTNPNDINAVFNMLSTNPKNNFTLGINDDITNLSLEPLKIDINDNFTEIKIYGYGSDGLVSASKNFLNLIGKKMYIQGFFKYDSRKSGGLTECNIRLSNDKINAPYNLTHPKIIIIGKDKYLDYYNIVDNIEQNGIIIINSEKEDIEISKILPNSKIVSLKNKKIKIYKIDASEIARRNNLDGKTGIILEKCLLEILNQDDLIEILKANIITRFKTKGLDIINNNLKSIENTSLQEVVLTENEKNEKEYSNLFEKIAFKKGENLTTKDVSIIKSGIYPGGLINYKNKIYPELVPEWIKENCIACNICSLVCPHGAITPKIENGISKIYIDTNICTGCGLCIDNCPGKNKNKALKMTNYYSTPYIEENLTNQFNKFNIKGSQYEEKKFKCPGACSGCGETPYIKLLTQLYGKELVIANATGCSSIYGGSSPYTPYTIPWANSLFEDNAEFALGINQSIKHNRNKLEQYLKNNMLKETKENQEIYTKWLINKNNFEITNNLKNQLNIKEELKDYITPKTVWAVGGDGWAYDIGFSGIDHILSSNENINILVLDSETYSNTGGQSSKSTRIGAVAEFANLGKTTEKKDLFKIAITYPNVYAASICLGANMMQTIKAFKEASEHQGPSIIIAYSPCVEQGLKPNTNSIEQEKLSVECGYNILMRYKDKQLVIDSGEPDYNKYDQFLNNEIRYSALQIKNPELAKNLLNKNKEASIKRYNYYKRFTKM